MVRSQKCVEGGGCLRQRSMELPSMGTIDGVHRSTYIRGFTMSMTHDVATEGLV